MDKEYNDQCDCCKLKGNIKLCENEECPVHESWYTKILRRHINLTIHGQNRAESYMKNRSKTKYMDLRIQFKDGTRLLYRKRTKDSKFYMESSSIGRSILSPWTVLTMLDDIMKDNNDGKIDIILKILYEEAKSCCT